MRNIITNPVIRIASGQSFISTITRGYNYMWMYLTDALWHWVWRHIYCRHKIQRLYNHITSIFLLNDLQPSVKSSEFTCLAEAAPATSPPETSPFPVRPQWQYTFTVVVVKTSKLIVWLQRFVKGSTLRQLVYPCKNICSSVGYCGGMCFTKYNWTWSDGDI